MNKSKTATAALLALMLSACQTLNTGEHMQLQKHPSIVFIKDVEKAQAAYNKFRRLISGFQAKV